MKLGKRCLQHSAGLAEQQALQLARMLKWEPSAEFFQNGPGDRGFIFQVEVEAGKLYVISKVNQLAAA